MREERTFAPPPGVPKELIDNVEKLKWLRYVASILPDLPDGKLRESVERDIVALRTLGTIHEEMVHKLELQISRQQQELNTLRERNVILETASKDVDDQDEVGRPNLCRNGWKWSFWILLLVFVLYFFLK